jgi:hypothetical protein
MLSVSRPVRKSKAEPQDLPRSVVGSQSNDGSGDGLEGRADH